MPGMLPFFRVVFTINTHITGIMERHRTHIAGALHVVLSTQRIEPSSIPPDMTGEKREMDQRQGGSCSMRQLRDAHTPIDSGVLGRSIHASSFANVRGGHPGNFLSVFRSELLQRLKEV